MLINAPSTPRHPFPLLLAIAAALATPALATAKVNVVTTLSPYASIAEAVGGDRVAVQSISRPDEDAHFVKPKPSFALMLRDADLFVTTGLDLEAWAPVLVDKSGNREIRVDGNGYVSASEGVPLLEVPDKIDRSAGDVHIYGNPHLFTSPLNAKIVAANIAKGLKRVDPAGAADYDAGLARFQKRIDESLYGPALLAVLGSDVLDPLARRGELISFLKAQELDGKPLVDRLGGWLGKALPIRGREIVTYHKNWIYFTELFGLVVADYVEPKPGIPPSARHVHDLIELVSSRKIGVLLAANYFSKQEIEQIAERTGSHAVIVPLGPGAGGPPDYVSLVDSWVDQLVSAFAT
jgi:zinc/manganese transport system substrate-binding protein